MATKTLAAPYWVYLMPVDKNSGYCVASLELEVARFWSKGEATAYAIWRHTANNDPGHVFEVRRGKNIIYRAG